MKRRKLVIALILILTMLVQCITPLCMGVKAATGTEITLNENLYIAVRDSLIEEKQASFSYSNSKHVITIEDSELVKVTKLNLAEKDISDLTGLSTFYALTYLDLSSNALTVDSNLEELNSLNLEYLDLSSNQLTSIKMLTNTESIELFDISNQKVIYSEVIQVTDDSDEYYTVELPDILLVDGALKSKWFSSTVSEGGTTEPIWSSVDMYDNHLDIHVRSGTTQLKGLITINIFVDQQEFPNSKLIQTDMTLYYCVVPDGYTGILFKDRNLYEAVRDQLTGGQTENKDLDSYKNSKTTLYDEAYDDAMILVIDDNTLLNKIPSLILNNKQITDLTGLEAFIGLDKDLNLSYNYIDSIDVLIELAENKITAEEKLQTKYTDKLAILTDDRSNLMSNEEALASVQNELAKLRQELAELIQNGGSTDAQSSKLEQIDEKEIEEEYYKEQVKSYKKYVKEDISDLYEIYNNVYLLTTILTPETIVVSESDINSGSSSQVKSWAQSIMTNISTLETTGSLTTWESDMIIKTFSIPTTKTVTKTDTTGATYETTEDIEYPIKEFFDDFESSTYYSKNGYKGFLTTIKEMDAVIVAGNYCVYNKTYGGSSDCTYKDAFDILINRLDSFVLPTDYAEKAKSKYSTYSSTCMCESFSLDDDIEEISGKLVNNSGLISTLVKVPRLRSLNLAVNNITSAAGIEILAELRTLNLYQNFLGTGNISEVDWQSFEYLEDLNLGYNQLLFDDIKCLEGINSLINLDLSKNLLSGEFDFNILSLPNLMFADFSYNQITDIEQYINQYQFQAMDYGMDAYEFILSDETPTVLFQYQDLEIDAVFSQNDSNFVTIDLPPIFSQVEKIDDTRTSFTIDSKYGSVDSTGKTVTLYIPNLGDYTDIVGISNKNGYDYEEYAYGIGYGTTCRINYTVVEEGEDFEDVVVDDTSIDSTKLQALVKETGEFEFTFTGKDLDTRDLTFEWRIDGNTSDNTTITVEGDPVLTGTVKLTQNATLKVGSDETADEITIIVDVYENGSYLTSESITVGIIHDGNVDVDGEVTWNTYDDEDKFISVGAGEDQVIEYTYDSSTVTEDMVVSWEISGNTSSDTTITGTKVSIDPGVTLIADAILHIGSDETADEIIVTVTLSDGTTRSLPFVKTVTSTETETETDGDEEDTDIDTDIDEDIDEDIDDSSSSSSGNSGSFGSGDQTSETDTDEVLYGYDVDLDKSLVYVNVPGTTVSTFEKNLVTTSGYTVVVESNSQNVDDETVIATSAVAIVYDTNGQIVKELEVVVLGDVNGDGKVNALDSGLIRKVIDDEAYIVGTSFRAAADVDRDGEIDESDSVLVLQYRAKIIKSF